MSADPLISQTIGNYEILSRVGKGGMAIVYRARQRNMGRDVAIKVMSADIAENPQFIARFEREAQVIANLQHPRVLPVHDFGHSGELFYLVMRLIEGESLYHRLMHGALPLLTAAKFLDQMAEALDYAHSQGVVHRDLKPNNILIDEWDNLYLMDFGLAKLLAESQNLTQTGTVLGTPAYMAPEQWRGEPVDARTDVYSLAVILYEMVVGRAPFSSDSTTPFTLMYKHLNDAPPPPRESLPDLPEEVERVILKALAKTKEERYQSAGELAREFGEVVRVAGSLAIKQRAQLAAAPPSGETPQAPEESVPPIPVAAPESDQAVKVEPAAEEKVENQAPQAASLPKEKEAESAASAPAESVSVPEPAVLPPPPVILPPPVNILPPPPPIPLPGAPRAAAGPFAPIEGQPGESRRRPHDFGPHNMEGMPSGMLKASEVLRHTMEAVDIGLDIAFEKAAEAMGGPSSSEIHLPAKRDAIGLEDLQSSDAFQQMRQLVAVGEPLIGVLDMRGTPQWRMWKQLLVGGFGLNLLGGILGVGMLGALGWLAWIFLIVQVVRTWRLDIGGYYLGFTPDRVILLPHDVDGQANYRGGVMAANWSAIERLRLTDRYALLDMSSRSGDKVHFGGIVLANGDGGLGAQRLWLAHSQIPALIAGNGFETKNL